MPLAHASPRPDRRAQRERGSRTALALVALGAACAFAALPACNIIGTAAVIAQGPPTIDAVHTLDPKRPTLVLVDDRDNRLPRPSNRLLIAQTAQDLLLKERALKDAIDCKAAYAVIAGDTADRVTSTIELARRLGAEVVVYVSVDRVEPVQTDRLGYVVSMRAKVLDATKDQPRIWPEDKEGHRFAAQLHMTTTPESAGPSAAMAVERSIATQAGRAVAQLFVEHLVSEAASLGKS